MIYIKNNLYYFFKYNFIYTNKITLKLKLGIDPTGCSLHLGHYFLLNNIFILKKIINIKIILLIGNYTAGLNNKIKQKKILFYSINIIKQLIKIFINNNIKYKLYYNNYWFNIKTINSFFIIFKGLKIVNIINTNNKKQINQYLYPLFQAYDNYILRPDIEIGGIDQKCNFKMCFLNRIKKIYFFLFELLLDENKNKISKTLNKNYNLNTIKYTYYYFISNKNKFILYLYKRFKGIIKFIRIKNRIKTVNLYYSIIYNIYKDKKILKYLYYNKYKIYKITKKIKLIRLLVLIKITNSLRESRIIINKIYINNKIIHNTFKYIRKKGVYKLNYKKYNIYILKII